MMNTELVKPREIRQCTVSEINAIGKNLVEFKLSGKTICRERFDIYNNKETTQAVSRFLRQIGSEPTTTEVAKWVDTIQRVYEGKTETTCQPVDIVKAADIANRNPSPMEPAVINGLLRFGETANINAVTKAGKSWLTLEIATAVTTGTKILDTFITQQSPVLIVDNELKAPTLEDRIRRVAKEKQIDLEGLPLDWVTVRGKGWNLIQLGEYLLNSLEAEQYGLINGPLILT